MSSEAERTGDAGAAAKQAPTEQQESKPGVPKRFAPGQTVCNERNEKGKLCNGHLKELNTQHPSRVFLRGDDTLYRCQACGALYMGPPMGHVRDASKQARYVERDLAAILSAAGGTLPAYDYPTPAWRGEPTRKAVRPAATAKPAALKASAAAPEGETPEQKKARLVAEHKAKLAAKSATPAAGETATAGVSGVASDAPTAAAASSASADAHRPAAEAQAATGQASAAPLSPTAATASPAAGAETASDLGTEASTELTPGAPKDERPAAVAAPAAEAKPKPKKGAGGFKVPPELQPKPGETLEEKIARLKATAEAAKRASGKA
jgi:hypothetical protein